MPPGSDLRAALLVAAGSAAGGVCRWWISGQLDPAPGGFPLGIFLINLLGCLLLGLVAARGPEARLLLGTGFAGGFTTYSTWTAQIHALSRGAPALAALYLGATLAGGAAAYAAGLWLGGARAAS